MKTKTEAAKHTPGPWKLNETRYPNGDMDVNAFNPNEKDYVFQHSALATVSAHTQNHGDWRDRDRSEVEANARLIAAAPDLLAAAKEAVAWAAQNGYCAKPFGNLTAAIAKAQGDR